MALNGVFTKRVKILWVVLLASILLAGTGPYIAPSFIRGSPVNLNTGIEPRSLSDIINFTQRANLNESQLLSLSPSWFQALRFVNHNNATVPVYQEGCSKYSCADGPPVPKDVETGTFNVGVGPSAVSFSPTSNVFNNSPLVYVASPGSNSLTAIATNTGATLNLALGVAPTALGVNPNGPVNGFPGPCVYIALSNNTVSVRCPLVLRANIPLPSTLGGPLSGIGVNTATNRVYVAANSANSVVAINGTSNKILHILPPETLPFSIAANPVTNRVYVTNELATFSPGMVVVLNGTSDVILTNFPCNCDPRGIAVNPTTNRFYVSSDLGITVYNGSNNTLIATIPVGFSQQFITVNPTTNRIYVASGPNTLSVIDGATNSVVQTIAAGSSPSGIGVNPATKAVYVANTADSTVSVISQRPEITDACIRSAANCLIVSSTGTLFPGTTRAIAVNLLALSLYSNATKSGTQMALTVVCDLNTTNSTRQCSTFYVDGNVWSPSQTDLSKSPFIIQNAEPYFYLQFHWWDFQNSRIVTWGTWWYGTAVTPNWFWGVYWWWRTYIAYYVGIPYIPWWWWSWHWVYWRYWGFWGTNFST